MDAQFWNESDQDVLERFVGFKDDLIKVVEESVVGQKNVVEEILAAFFAGEHLLLSGVPGIGKSSVLRAISERLRLQYYRSQFTPDLYPGDLCGSNSLHEGARWEPRSVENGSCAFFSNIFLAEEVERAPHKTQAFLLDAMRERRIDFCGRRFELDDPFFVVVTRNPMESDNARPFSLGQIDRFLFYTEMDYPKNSDEIKTVLRSTSDVEKNSSVEVSRDELLGYRRLVKRIVAPQNVVEFAVKIIRRTRPQTKYSSRLTQQYVEWGGSPYASRAVVLAAKAFAAFAGRREISMDDVERVVPSVLRGRIVLNHLAQSDGITVDLLVRKITREVRMELEENSTL